MCIRDSYYKIIIITEFRDRHVSYTCGTRSGVYANAQFESVIRTMTNCEPRDEIKEIQSQITDLDNMTSSVGLWQSAHNHVRVTNRFHLI